MLCSGCIKVLRTMPRHSLLNMFKIIRIVVAAAKFEMISQHPS